MKKQLYRAAAATVLGLSLTTGVVAADTGDISYTGPDSSNRVSARATDNSSVDNDTSLRARVDNDQHAYTGDAKVNHNTEGGSAQSGNADNSNDTSLDATVDNSASSGGSGGMVFSDASGSINHSGPGSSNTVSSTQTDNSSVSNTTHIDVHNSNDQRASSGDATVWGNTTGGDATSGNASNTNSSSFTFSVTN